LLIVIEGVDRTGKSTLARRIAERIGAEVIHAGVPTKGSIEEYETALNGYDPREEEHLVLDRWHVGEYVWPEIFGRESDFDLATRRHVEMFMSSRGATVVYGDRDREKLKKELVLHNEPLAPEDLERASGLFAQARTFKAEYVDVWDYDYDGEDKIVNIIREAQVAAWRVGHLWNEWGPAWVGRPNGNRVLLVGDQQGPEHPGRNPPYRVPFAPYRGTSGHYLLSALESWRKTAIVNAHDRDTGQEYDLEMGWKVLGCPLIVALGELAARAVEGQGLPYKKVPHPQYWRRFNYANLTDYTSLLEKGKEALV